MKSEKELINILSNHQLKATAKRKAVLSLFHQHSHALSSKMIEEGVGEIDRVTLYRLLNSFEDAGIIHKVTNNNGDTFYAKCSECMHNHHEDDHAHFHCQKCKNVYCLDHVHADDIKIPKSYIANFINLAVYGLCKACNHNE